MSFHLLPSQKWPVSAQRHLETLFRVVALTILLVSSVGSGLLYTSPAPFPVQAASSVKPGEQIEPAQTAPALHPQAGALQPVSNPTAYDQAVIAGLAPAQEPDYPLPPELQGQPEVVAQRTAESATFAMPDGSYAVMNESHPMHYQDASGEWRRIDPRFETVNEGWANTHNSFQTHLAQASSAARLNTPQSGLVWEPQRLSLVSDETSTLLADARPNEALTGQLSSDGQRVHYRKGWSQPGLEEVWTSQYGAVEYNLVLQERPALPDVASTTEDTALELQVRLRLLPGFQVRVNGQPLDLGDLPLETAAPIEFSVKDGAETSALVLQPPLAYEQAMPAQRMPGVYSLRRGAESGELELGVRIPWAWLNAPERQFPVVLDPLFQMKTATQMYGLMYTDPDHVLPQNYDPGIGAWGVGTERQLMKFNLPSQPFMEIDQLIERAVLVATPTDHSYIDLTDMAGNVLLYELTADVWSDAPPAHLPVASQPVAPGAQLMSYGWGDTTLTGSVMWDITEQVKNWYGDFSQNHGLMLRMEQEFCTNCPGFDFAENNWIQDDYVFFAEHSTSANPVIQNPGNKRGGIRLMVFYRPRPLAAGTRFRSNANPFWVYGGIPDGQDPYMTANHQFSLPPLPAKWQAITLRGLGERQGVLPVTEGNPGPTTLPMQGSLGGYLQKDNGATLANLHPQAGQVGFVMLDGRGNQGTQLNFTVQPLEGQTPPPHEYETLLASEGGSISVVSPGTTVSTFNYDTDNPMRLFNLQLPPQTNTRVDISFEEDNLLQDASQVELDQYYDTNVKSFSAFLFESDPAGAVMPVEIDEFSSNASRQAIHEDYAKYHLGSTDFNPQSGKRYALALTYNGPELNMYASQGMCSEFPCAPEATLQAFKFHVRVTSCPLWQVATSSGSCLNLVCPNTADSGDVNKRRDKEGFSLWSDNGWTDSDAATSASSNPDVIPLVGPVGEVPTVAAIEARLSYNTVEHTVRINATGDAPRVWLVNCGTFAARTQEISEANYLEVFTGDLKKGTSGTTPVLIPRVPNTTTDNVLFNAWSTADKPSLSNSAFHVNPHDGRAYASAVLSRDLAGDDPAVANPATVNVNWSVNYLGWASPQIQIDSNPGNAEPALASMKLTLGSTFSLDMEALAKKSNPRKFLALRASDATITLPEGLGGASRKVTALIFPNDEPPPQKSGQETPALCADHNCVDLRAPEDTQASPKYEWEAPDVLITGAAGMVVQSMPGSLEVHSIDHPYRSSNLATGPVEGAPATELVDVGLDENTDAADPLALDAIPQQYAFSTLGGKVQVSREACVPGGAPVTVVRGQTQMSMPSIGGEEGQQNFVSASYKICQTSLRTVSFQFYSSIGIPVGSSGLFLTGMGGTVDILPSHTTIQFRTDLQTGQGNNGVIWKGTGTVTIDTRGYFEFASTGKILGVVDTTGKLWVSWEPLDVGFDARIGLGSWLSGNARAHIWEGQGWQNKYSWLPDNDEKHLAASVSAKITIEEGAAFSWWFIDIPPSDITFGLEIAFGQFCTSSDCSSYEWGVKGKFTIAGYDIGLYYGFDDGFDFILGNDGHVLIDEFGGALSYQTVQGMVNVSGPGEIPASDGTTGSGIIIEGPPPTIDGVGTRTVAVGPGTEQILVGLGWEAGSPQLQVLDHTGQDVTTSAAYTVAFTSTLDSMLMGIQLHQPQSGEWQVKVSNLAGQENYKLIVFASKGSPDHFEDKGAFLTPAINNDPSSGQYKISWRVPQGTPANATISLYYHKLYIKNRLPLIYSRIPVPIVKNLPFTAGEYLWDTSGMRAGSYKLYAEVDDGVNAFPESNLNADGQAQDYCQPGSGLPSTRAFAPERFPGLARFTSAGTVQITDTTPPATPTGLAVTGVSHGLMARWDPNPDKDLAGYVVRWGTQFYISGPGWVWSESAKEIRVTPTDAPVARLGGLNPFSVANYRHAVEVRAVDTNGNVSTGITLSGEPTDEPAAQVPLPPKNLQVLERTLTSVRLSWTPDPTYPADSYQVVYTSLIDGVETGTTNGETTTETSVLVSGLQRGATYNFYVMAVNADGWQSAPSAPLKVLAGRSLDLNANDLPDDWEFFYFPGMESVDKYADPDQDGLGNIYEAAMGSNPTDPDTDHDGFSDMEELNANTDAFDPSRYPAEMQQPRLQLSQQQLLFQAQLGSPSQTQVVSFENTGGGTMVLKAVPNVPWITTHWMVGEPGSNTGHVEVGVATRDLAPGFYSGVIRFGAGDGSDPIPAGQMCVRVNVWVSPTERPAPQNGLFFPVIVTP